MGKQLCMNLRDDGNICGVPIEWLVSKKGNKYCKEVDTGNFHNCKWYDPSKKKVTATKELRDTLNEHLESETIDRHGEKINKIYNAIFDADDNNRIAKIEKALGDILEIIAKQSFETGGGDPVPMGAS